MCFTLETSRKTFQLQQQDSCKVWNQLREVKGTSLPSVNCSQNRRARNEAEKATPGNWGIYLFFLLFEHENRRAEFKCYLHGILGRNPCSLPSGHRALGSGGWGIRYPACPAPSQTGTCSRNRSHITSCLQQVPHGATAPPASHSLDCGSKLLPVREAPASQTRCEVQLTALHFPLLSVPAHQQHILVINHTFSSMPAQKLVPPGKLCPRLAQRSVCVWCCGVTHIRGPRSEENSQWNTMITRLFSDGRIGFFSKKSSTSSSIWRFTAPCRGSHRIRAWTR